MDAIETLKTAFRRIAPVGNPIKLKTKALQEPLLNAKTCQFYQSGTAALAAAVCIARDHKPCDSPEVILPAYACPDLVSAVLYAGCQPVLADIEGDSPYLKLAEVEAKLNSNTIAIIAPWFLGIPERFDALKHLAASQQALVIEDSAQWFPEADEPYQLQGDLAIYSFGKGKPVSLLGGGALVCPNPELFALAPTPVPATAPKPWLQLAKWQAYNGVIHPLCYWLLELLPLGMGKTVFHPLHQLEALPAMKLAYLQANIDAYRQTPEVSDWQNQLPASVTPVSAQCPSYQQQKRLRLAILTASAEQKILQLKHWQNAGCGASSFYPSSLPQIENIPDCVKHQGPFPGAETFASKLITLPTHRYANRVFSGQASEAGY